MYNSLGGGGWGSLSSEGLIIGVFFALRICEAYIPQGLIYYGKAYFRIFCGMWEKLLVRVIEIHLRKVVLHNHAFFRPGEKCNEHY